MKYGTVVTTTTLNLRDAPNGNDIGDLFPGDEVVWEEVSGNWLHLVDALRGNFGVKLVSGKQVYGQASVWASNGGGLYIKEHSAPAHTVDLILDSERVYHQNLS